MRGGLLSAIGLLLPLQALALTCNIGEWECKDGSKCIPQSAKCDGEKQCEDYSDEWTKECGNCTVNPGLVTSPQGGDLVTWHPGSICVLKNGDTLIDQPQNTTVPKCEKGQWACANGKCIPERKNVMAERIVQIIVMSGLLTVTTAE